jgi:hypothetical protein
MIKPSLRAVGLAVVLTAMMIGDPSGTNAAGPFDGPWSVTISTSRGDCGSNSLYGVVITNGSVRYAGGAGVQMSGHVSHNGSVSVSVRQGDKHASGSGRLRGNSGSGSWSGASSTGRCSGSWSAQRSG